MAHGGIKEATAFSIPIGPFTPSGVEGEMTRVSIASLLDGGGAPVTSDSPGNGGNYVTVGQHGMIADLYSSGAQSPVTLDHGLAAPTPPALVDDLVRHDLSDILSGGNVPVPLDPLLHGDDAGAALGFSGEQHNPAEAPVPGAGQSVLGGAEVPVAPVSAFAFSALELGHHEVTYLGGDQLVRLIDVPHFMA